MLLGMFYNSQRPLILPSRCWTKPNVPVPFTSALVMQKQTPSDLLNIHTSNSMCTMTKISLTHPNTHNLMEWCLWLSTMTPAVASAILSVKNTVRLMDNGWWTFWQPRIKLEILIWWHLTINQKSCTSRWATIRNWPSRDLLSGYKWLIFSGFDLNISITFIQYSWISWLKGLFITFYMTAKPITALLLLAFLIIQVSSACRGVPNPNPTINANFTLV